jgi:protein involved in polysaccharide export with SLBB domain
MKESLRVSEWVILSTLLFFMLSLVAIAKYNAARSRALVVELSSIQEEFLVTIRGAVKKPGIYRVVEGSTLEEVVRRAKPSPDANLEKVALNKIIDASMELEIEDFEWIRVSVSGAIAESVDLMMPVRSRICDLKERIIFIPETKKSFFKRRKLLRNGDKIEVPRK